ncbi:MAG: hypothetical protein AVDCRST_MAG40-1880, partial [uncultured Gemmatimonadaceae bacterium]
EHVGWSERRAAPGARESPDTHAAGVRRSATRRPRSAARCRFGADEAAVTSRRARPRCGGSASGAAGAAERGHARRHRGARLRRDRVRRRARPRPRRHDHDARAHGAQARPRAARAAVARAADGARDGDRLRHRRRSRGGEVAGDRGPSGAPRSGAVAAAQVPDRRRPRHRHHRREPPADRQPHRGCGVARPERGRHATQQGWHARAAHVHAMGGGRRRPSATLARADARDLRLPGDHRARGERPENRADGGTHARHRAHAHARRGPHDRAARSPAARALYRPRHQRRPAAL